MFSISSATLMWIVIAVVPGFVFQRMYSLLTPVQPTDSDKNILEYVTISMVNFSLWSWLLFPLNIEQISSWPSYKFIITIGLVCYLSPAVLAWIWFRCRNRWLVDWFLERPEPRGWDYFIIQNRCFMILIHLKCGRMMGGYFGNRSYASIYPHEPELYIQQLWRVDSDGKFSEPIQGSLGIVIKQSEWDRVEFFEATAEVEGNEIQEGYKGAIPETGCQPTHRGGQGPEPSCD